VHRDYHSRNLLLLEDGRVGVLDFQDAVWGPISYDIVSLLKDCYIRWPRESVLNLVNYYHDMARAENILINVPFEQFHNWFELMGIQRHLKALGIFARLDAYYGKPGYLKDMPRTLSYIEDAIVNYPALTGLKVFLQNEVRPRLSVNEARTSAA
jgi:hypothetical protein